MCMSSVIETFQNYIGTGSIVIWFLLALLYLLYSEKHKARRILFVYAPILLLLLFFNPLFAKLFFALVGEEIYFRNLWLLPIIVVIAYAAVQIFGKLKGKKAVSFAVIVVLLIAFSGRLVYRNPLYSKAENPYHVPNAVVHVCDAIEVPEREVMAVFPRELLLYVRQYSPVVRMPYGRDALIWGANWALYKAMEAVVVELDELVPLAREAGCHYIVLRSGKRVAGNPQDYGLEWFMETDGYVVYRDTAVELIIPHFE